MIVIPDEMLRDYAASLVGHKSHKALKSALDAWYSEARKADWSKMQDIKDRYATASVISAVRVVFNIKGNDYRLVAAVDFGKKIVLLRWVGTHEDYDKIDVKTV